MPKKYDLDYLYALLKNRIEESLHLEYKSSDALGRTDHKKKEISKDVSAMANSAGGVVIYGIKEYDEHEKRHLPEKLDPVKRDDFAKEWLDQVINSNIHPKIANIVITPIPVNEQEVIYAVKIPQSDTVHQASDKRYYKRYNFESVAMDDYEVKDIMNRAKSPRIVLEFEMSVRDSPIPPYEPDFSINKNANGIDNYTYKDTSLLVYAHNHGSVYAEFVNFFIYMPLEIMKKGYYYNNGNYQKIEKNGDVFILYKGDNTERDVMDYNVLSSIQVPRFGASRYSPILPGLRKLIAKIDISDNPDMYKDVRWIVYADNSKPIEDKVKIKDIPVVKASEI